jgi:hypothetical protein
MYIFFHHYVLFINNGVIVCSFLFYLQNKGIFVKNGVKKIKCYAQKSNSNPSHQKQASLLY